jgi:hypothetical protein
LFQIFSAFATIQEFPGMQSYRHNDVGANNVLIDFTIPIVDTICNWQPIKSRTIEKFNIYHFYDVCFKIPFIELNTVLIDFDFSSHENVHNPLVLMCMGSSDYGNSVSNIYNPTNDILIFTYDIYSYLKEMYGKIQVDSDLNTYNFKNLDKLQIVIDTLEQILQKDFKLNTNNNNQMHKIFEGRFVNEIWSTTSFEALTKFDFFKPFIISQQQYLFMDKKYIHKDYICAPTIDKIYKTINQFNNINRDSIVKYNLPNNNNMIMNSSILCDSNTLLHNNINFQQTFNKKVSKMIQYTQYVNENLVMYLSLANNYEIRSKPIIDKEIQKNYAMKIIK